MSRTEEFPEYLSPAERLRGQRLIRRFITLNGISVAFLMNDLLILYGIRNGLTDPQVAVLASFMHLTMPFMVLGKLAIPRIGLARTWGDGWFMRYVTGSILILAPFLGAAGAPQWSVTAIVLFGAFGFSMFRSIGLVANSPLMGEVTTDRDRGRFISGNWVRAQSTYFLAMALVVVLMRIFDKLWVYQAVIGLGCAVGFYASRQLVKVPESREPSRSAERPLVESLRTAWSRPRFRRILGAWAAAISSFVLVIPFAIVTIKRGYGISDHTALLFSLLVLAGGILSSAVNGGISDRVGPRPLLILYVSGFLLVAGFWALAPGSFYPVPVSFAFFVAGYCKTGIILTVSHYFLAAVEKKERVSMSLFARMASGAVAGLMAAAGSGTVLKFLRDFGMEGMDVYRAYFRIALPVLMIIVVLVFRLERLREWKVRRVLGLLFSMRDIMALAVMNRLDRSEDMDTDLAQVRRLERLGASISESSLRNLLDSPRLAVRREAIRALRRIDFGSKTTTALLRELERGEFTTGAIAAETLGEHGCAEALPALRKSLESEDSLQAGRAMVALMRLGDRESLPAIRRMFEESENPRTVVHGAHALAETGRSTELEPLLRKACDLSLPAAVTEEIFTVTAELCGGEGFFYRFLREYNNDPPLGLGHLASTVEQVLGRRCTFEDDTTEVTRELALEVCSAALEKGGEADDGNSGRDEKVAAAAGGEEATTAAGGEEATTGEACIAGFRDFLERRQEPRIPIKLFACIAGAAAAHIRDRRVTGTKRNLQEEV